MEKCRCLLWVGSRHGGSHNPSDITIYQSKRGQVRFLQCVGAISARGTTHFMEESKPDTIIFWKAAIRKVLFRNTRPERLSYRTPEIMLFRTSLT